MPTVTDQVASFSSKLRTGLEIVAENGLSDRDKSLIYDVLTMRYALLFDLLDGSTQAEITATWRRTLLGLKTLEVESYARDWKTLREIWTSIDYRVAAKLTYSDPFEADAAYNAFKHASHGLIHNKWISNSVQDMLKAGVRWSDINQWIVFDTRVNLTSLDLTLACCAEYLASECELQNRRVVQVWDRSPEIRNLLQRCAKDLWGDFEIQNYPFRPKHGNGATAEVSRADADPWHKNRYFSVDGEIITYLRHRVPEEDWRGLFYLPYRGLDRVSELVCVPKSMTSNRTISKEPTTLQFLQQDIFGALDDYFCDHPYLGIDLHDQDRSRQLALVGSFDSSYATIDLSSASDYVTRSLVEMIFDGLPVLYPLTATRSWYVRMPLSRQEIAPMVERYNLAALNWLDDYTFETEKFAPMGSATCFPVETMVFTTICEAAVRACTGRASRYEDYRVYGDDIVIRREFAETAVSYLEGLGFVVNTSKSFGLDGVLDDPDCSMPFREACGIEALAGKDVTPLRLSRRLVSVTDNDSCHQAGLGVGFVDLLNRAYLKGFWHLRRWLNSQLVKYKWYRTCLRLPADDYREFAVAILNKRTSWITVSIPFVITDETSATQWRCFAARSSATSRFQRCAALVTVAKARGPRVLYHDSNDYYTWCLKASGDTVEDELVVDDTGVVTIRPGDLKWSHAWVSLQRPAQLKRLPSR